MIPDSTIKALTDIVGRSYLSTLDDDLLRHASDATKLVYLPDVVVHPADAGEISRILILANEALFPVIPRGAGTGQSGGALPVKGGVILAMDRLNRILDIDQDNLVVKAEPGVITAHLQEAVEKVGLFYPPDPASIHIATLGGNVAENAGGLRAVKYGVTRDYVLGLTVVLPTGEIIKTGVETAKGVVGYDLTRLLVGSEGTLGVITDITLRLIPKPETKKTVLAFFEDAQAAVNTVSNIIRSKIVPTTLEFMDRVAMDAVREDFRRPVPKEAGALLLIEVDGDAGVVKKEADQIKTQCLKGGAVRFEEASSSEETRDLWSARREVSLALRKLKPGKISEDIVVPRNLMDRLVDYLHQLGRKYGLPVASYGHAGDGNLHANILLDDRVPEEKEKAEKAVRELFEKVIALRGTISGEHGIGLTKAPYIEMELSRDALDLMSRIKQAFDPNNVLNPGKIFP